MEAQKGRGARGSVVFVHGVGGPVPGWDGGLRRSLADAGGGVPRWEPLEARYDDLLDGPPRPSEVDSTRAQPSVETKTSGGLTTERLRSLVAAAVVTGQGTDGRRRLQPRVGVPGGVVVRIPWAGMPHARRYRTDRRARREVQGRIVDAVRGASGPVVLLAHSLGSVVAVDALFASGVPVDLLVTIGSPLGIDRVWGCRWVGRDLPSQQVGAWLNVVNTRDVIPWGRGAEPRFPSAVDAFITAGSMLPGAGSAHDPATYTAARVVGGAVREVLLTADR